MADETQALLPVTQADREALEDIDDALGFLTESERPIVLQALARHRLASAGGGVDTPLREHFTRMMEAAANYIEPTTYIARHPRQSLIGPCRFQKEFPMPDANHTVSAKIDILTRRDQAFICDMIYMLDGPEQRAALIPSSNIGDGETGWIVGNSNRTKWRMWTELGPDWIDDREAATRYARRVDAEQVHAADEDAWRIEPYAALTPSALSGDAGEMG